jgi:hypothetical protein
MRRLVGIVLLLSGLALAQGSGGSGHGSSGSGLPAGWCTDSLSPGAQTITWTAGHTYCPNAVGTYTFASAQAINVNNVTVYCSNPGMVLQRTGTTDGFDWSGNDGRIVGCALDGNTQSGAGTGPMVLHTGNRLLLEGNVFQNYGNTNPTSAFIESTAGTDLKLRNNFWAGTLTDPGVLWKPPAAGVIVGGLLENNVVNAFNPGASAFSVFDINDGAGSSAGVQSVKWLYNRINGQGSNVSGLFAFHCTINAGDTIPSFNNDMIGNKVKLTSTVQDAYRWFGCNHGTMALNELDANSQAMARGAAIGDFHFSNFIDNNLDCDGPSTDCVDPVDYSNSHFDRNTLKNVSGFGIHATTSSGIGQSSTFNGNRISFIASNTGTGIRLEAGGGNVVSGNYVEGNIISGNGTAGQIGIDTNIASGTLLNNYIGPNQLFSLGTGIAVGASSSNTELGLQQFTSVTTQVTDAGTGTFGTTKIVRGTCTLGTSCAVTLPQGGFTATTSYQCQATDTTTAAATKVVNTSATVATFTGTGTDVLAYTCSGF